MNWAANCKFRIRRTENTNKKRTRAKQKGKKVKHNFQETELEH